MYMYKNNSGFNYSKLSCFYYVFFCLCVLANIYDNYTFIIKFFFFLMALSFMISVQTQNFSFKPPSSLGPTSNHSGSAFVPTFLYPKNGSSKLTVLKRHGSPSESVQKFSSLCSCHFFYLRNYPASLNTLSEFINK